jgi:hypothetical protein
VEEGKYRVGEWLMEHLRIGGKEKEGKRTKSHKGNAPWKCIPASGTSLARRASSGQVPLSHLLPAFVEKLNKESASCSIYI